MTTNDRTPAQGHGPAAAGPDPAPHYEIRVTGRVPPRWSAWFDGVTVAPQEDGTTVIRGEVVDQAALHGLLQKLRDVGIPLVSLTPLPSDTPTAPPAPPTQQGS